MNSVTAYRRSTVGPPVLHYAEGAADATLHRRRTFHPVDWPTYKKNCDVERASTIAEVSLYDYDSDKSGGDLGLGPWGVEPEPIGFGEGLARILTVAPYRDAQWVVSVLFIVGSTAFTASSFFALFALVFPRAVFPGQMDVAFPTCITVGAGIFFVAGNLATVASFNVNRGPAPDGAGAVGRKREELAPEPRYNPALLGSKEWVWTPPAAELRAVFLPNPAFQAGLVSMLGGLVLTASAVGGNPLILGPPDAPDFFPKLRDLVLIPLTIGGGLLGLGGLALTLLAQERWYKPALASVAWHTSFWNTVGAMSLSLSSLYNILFPEDMLSPAVVNFVATWLFFLAAYLQWHMLMAFYPRRAK